MTLSGKRVFVSGSDGFIGSHLAEALTSGGAQVTALVQYNAFGRAGWLDEIDRGVRSEMNIVLGDIRDGAHMTRLLEGQDVVFHLAALIGIPHSYVAADSYVATNVSGTLNLLEAARRADVGRFVHTSTSEVYGSAITTPMSEEHPLQGQSPYSASKIGADMLAQSYALSFDLPVVTLRPFNTYGPRQSERAVIPTVIRQALDPDCGQIAVGDLTTVRDFTYVNDTVAGFVAIAGGENVVHGDVYNLGTGKSCTIGEMVEQVRRITGVNKPVVSDGARMRPEKSEVKALLADAGKFSNATGWRPAVDLEGGLGQTVEWWQERIEKNLVRPEAGYLT